MEKKLSKYEIELRPHHVLRYINYIKNPKANHFAEFRKIKGDFHSDKLVKHWINTLKSLFENPKLRFKYVQGIDSICKKCEHNKECHDKDHEYYKIVKKADKDAIKNILELEFGKVYTAKFLWELFRRKGWL
ncbi:MAG TPA: DUF1284 domain-containing protein [Candidatus Pacearchaeota archaeon]|nr:hypothetical protein BMS3Abin17_00837 [archaeon BMS3Abin17]HDK42753.1 DUF1284 domain-containing protein [Candidatus Pacearchaeota archaeon]HDZ60722.1 DUF1284 domain-containing protein [Candidatus Pacearchaeota archaeon]